MAPNSSTGTLDEIYGYRGGRGLVSAHMLGILSKMCKLIAGDVPTQRIAKGQSGSHWSSLRQQRLPRSRLLEGWIVVGIRGRISRSESGTLHIIIPKNHCVYHKLKNLTDSQGCKNMYAQEIRPLENLLK